VPLNFIPVIRQAFSFWSILFKALALFFIFISTNVMAECSLKDVKVLIDEVLDQDKQKAIEFMKQVKSGYDSLDVIGKLVSESNRAKIDECRFQAAEYLTKRGHPPAH